MNFWGKLKKPFFVLAPMADVTDVSFRRVIAKYGKPDVMWTEFVSADGLVRASEEGKKKLLKDLEYGEAERPIVAQLFSSRPEYMFDAAKLVKELTVSGAFHSPLMESACDGLREALEHAEIRNASVPVYANVTAKPVQEAREIRDLLFRQLTHPVRWEESVLNMASGGATTFVECGPGKVLQGLVKRILGDVEISGIEKFADISAKVVG